MLSTVAWQSEDDNNATGLPSGGDRRLQILSSPWSVSTPNLVLQHQTVWQCIGKGEKMWPIGCATRAIAVTRKILGLPWMYCCH